MEAYLNIPSFVCELIEKQLQDNKYKEVIEYIVQRRNEIENKKDYLSEQEKIKRYLDLQQKVEQLEKENEKLKYLADDSNTMKAFIVEHNKAEQLENIRKEAIEFILEGRYGEDDDLESISLYMPDLLNILNKGE